MAPIQGKGVSGPLGAVPSKATLINNPTKKIAKPKQHAIATCGLEMSGYKK